MSKVAIGIMTGVLALGIAGCSSGDGDTSKSVNADEKSKQVVHKEEEKDVNATEGKDNVETTPTDNEGNVSETSGSNSSSKNSSDDSNNNSPQESSKSNETPAILKEGQIKNLLTDNMDAIFSAFNKAGDQYGWNNANPSDFSKLSPKLTPYATSNFINNDLKSLAKKYYCECDEHFKPELNMDVRFSYEQNGNKLSIVALEPATDFLNMGSKWEFTYLFEDGKWKLNYWKATSLEHKNLNLTKDEAKALASPYGDKAEYDGAVTSLDADGAKAYVFRIYKNGKPQNVIGISATNTKLVYDLEEEFSIDDDAPATQDKDASEGGAGEADKKAEQDNSSQDDSSDTDKNNTTATLGNFNIYNEYLNIEVGGPDDNMHFGYLPEDLIAKFGKPIAITTSSNGADFQYSDAIYSLSRADGKVYKVTITGSRAASYYKDFATVKKVYEGDGVYGAFDLEETNDSEGYHLVYDNYSTARHTYTSSNQEGNPIKKIVVELTDN
ncbi:hypothetical protein O0Q50_19545 [Priestia aryabhattai]|uniref:Lipoprotein n=1 Tax=Priestia aryabhattai TaxID=412384 RepID=A0AAX6NCH1_PRIAR|nr:hypothetical protein [Priestia aryabhattai]MDU9693370.1 hypothetical protein [Priestia aryabhattai]